MATATAEQGSGAQVSWDRIWVFLDRGNGVVAVAVGGGSEETRGRRWAPSAEVRVAGGGGLGRRREAGPTGSRLAEWSSRTAAAELEGSPRVELEGGGGIKGDVWGQCGVTPSRPA